MIQSHRVRGLPRGATLVFFTLLFAASFLF